MDVCDDSEEPEVCTSLHVLITLLCVYFLKIHLLNISKDLSSSRTEEQGNVEGGLQCENPVNETLESHNITENGW